MKFLALLFLIISCSSHADFVYMRETGNGKAVMLNAEGRTTVMNQLARNEWAIYPDISADGNAVVYAEGAGNTDLHLTYMNLKSQEVRRFLLKDKGMLLHPKFSKNGRFIFYSAPGKNGKNTVFFFDHQAEIARQGQELSEFQLDQAQVLKEGEESYFPRPSSDGSFVVYQRNTAGKKEIVLLDRVENTQTVLAEGMSPALSFDERLVAYTSKQSGSWNIYVIDRTTMKVTEMTNDSHDEMAPTFLPDNTLAYASNKNGHFRLYKQSGEFLVNETETDVELYSPHFSGEKQFVQKERAPYIGNPRSSFGTVVHEGKIYMAGGHQGAEHTYPPESFTDSFISYDINANTWQTLAPRPFKAHGYQIVAHGNYVYAFGGFAYSENHKPKWKSLDSIDRYDIKANRWETVGKLFSPRSSNVALKIDEKVYIAAGWDSTPKFHNDADGTFLNTIEVFDLKSEKLELAPYKLPSPLRRALTGIEYQGKILLIGGLGVGSSHFELIQNVTSLDPITGKSEEFAPLPFATFAPAAEVLNNELFVFGGMFKTGEMAYEYVAHIYGMDMSSKVWRHTGRYLKETKGFSQVFQVDEKTLGILGGHRYFEGYDSPVTTFETFK